MNLEINKNNGSKYSKLKKKILSECLINVCSVRQEYLCINIHVTAGFLFTLGIPLCSYQLEYFLHFRAKFKLHFVQCQHSRVLPCKVFILIFTSTFSFHLV